MKFLSTAGTNIQQQKPAPKVNAASGAVHEWQIVEAPTTTDGSVLASPNGSSSPALSEDHNVVDNVADDDDIDNNINETTGKGREIDMNDIASFQERFDMDPSGRVAQNAATATSVKSITASRTLLQTSLSPYFSINLDHGGMPATDQAYSGRCWMFGTLNLFRFGTRDKLQLDNFEFSESYLLFFYLLEQVNYYLEFFIETADRSLDDRVISEFLGDVVDDGGDWGIAVNLIKKYGLVPKDVYPESFSSGYTPEVDTFLNKLVTATAFQIRNLLQGGASIDQARELKWKCVSQGHRVLAIHLGTPPSSKFDWHWRDNDGAFHMLKDCTPHDFVRKYVTVPFADYVSMIQDPRHEYYKRYQVEYSMPICGGDPIVFLNIPADEMKAMSRAMLSDGLPVFFACIVEVEENDEYGLWDENLYEEENFYSVTIPKMSKADRIRYGQSMGDHVMLITGVDVDETGATRRWRVENSWGTEGAGRDGYYTMNDNWFAENVFEIVGPSTYLGAAAKDGLKSDIRMLPAWDPMESKHRRSRKKSHRRRHCF